MKYEQVKEMCYEKY